MDKTIKTIRKISPSWALNLYHLVLAYAGAAVYRFPSRGMIIIGVTGTNGKSTVIEILHQILEDFGLRVASFSSLRWNILGKEKENRLKMTMPGRFMLQKFLSSARQNGCQFVILEVTSEGIKQYRHIGINFDIGVLTNLRPEHIESHGSFEAYRDAKGKLFKKLSRPKPGVKSISVVNLDDPSCFYYSDFNADRKFGFGLLKENIREGVKEVIPDNIRFSSLGSSFSYAGLDWKSPLVGDFNLYNVLSAVTVAIALKIPPESIRKSIRKVKEVPGRLEIIQEKPFRVIIDYAHTPDALESIYRTVHSFWLGPKNKLIAVFGATGGIRDHWKRPELGRIADRLADKIILTNEDPYDENPESILYDIKEGISKKKPEIIIERREAIARALGYAKEGDVVVITGKGAEKMIVTADGPVPWDDKKVAKEELKKLSISDKKQVTRNK